MSDDPDSPAVDQHRGGFRSYEVHQRERPGQATPLIRPGELRTGEYLTDPLPTGRGSSWFR